MTDAEIAKLIMQAGRVNAKQPLHIRNSGLNGQTILLIVAMFLSAAGPTLTGMGAWLNSKAAVANSDAARKSNAETADEVKKIHVAVNSERSEMVAKVAEGNDRILVLTKELATLREQIAPSVRQGYVRPAEPTASPQEEGPVESRIQENTAVIQQLLDEIKQYRSSTVDPGKPVQPALRTTK